MTKRAYIALCLYTVCTYSMQTCAFKILEDTPAIASMGYGNWDIKTDGELDLMRHLLKPQAIVFDVGSNIGEWSMYALGVEPTINLIAFEPVPLVYEQLKNRAEQLLLP
jgi:hypothetical protein